MGEAWHSPEAEEVVRPKEEDSSGNAQQRQHWSPAIYSSDRQRDGGRTERKKEKKKEKKKKEGRAGVAGVPPSVFNFCRAGKRNFQEKAKGNREREREKYIYLCDNKGDTSLKNSIMHHLYNGIDLH